VKTADGYAITAKLVGIREGTPTAGPGKDIVLDGDRPSMRSCQIGSAQAAREVALVGQNLTDEDVVGYSFDVPLAGAVFLAPGVSGYVKPPRTVAVQARLRF
jgi:hypothetical protein